MKLTKIIFSKKEWEDVDIMGVGVERGGSGEEGEECAQSLSGRVDCSFLD